MAENLRLDSHFALTVRRLPTGNWAPYGYRPLPQNADQTSTAWSSFATTVAHCPGRPWAAHGSASPRQTPTIATHGARPLAHSACCSSPRSHAPSRAGRRSQVLELHPLLARSTCARHCPGAGTRQLLHAARVHGGTVRGQSRGFSHGGDAFYWPVQQHARTIPAASGERSLPQVALRQASFMRRPLLQQ